MNISLPSASSQNPNNFKSQCFLVNLSTGKASKKLFLRRGENIHNGEELGNTNCCSVMIQPRSRYNEVIRGSRVISDTYAETRSWEFGLHPANASKPAH